MKYSHLKGGEYKEDQYYKNLYYDPEDAESFNNVLPMDIGVWTIQLILINDINNLAQSENIYLHKFMILPTDKTTGVETWNDLKFTKSFEMYWLMNDDQICINHKKDDKADREDDCKLYFWSTFYPDKKSDFFHSL
jgi:hypothetical protein